jgi:hypothetical protein
MRCLSRCSGRLMAAVLLLMLGAQQPRAAQSPAPAELRAALEGTWQLAEWHVDGQVLRPPQIDGRWSNRDGVVLVIFHRTTGQRTDTTSGYGVYQMDAGTWGYRYDHMETSSRTTGGPTTVTVSPPGQMRSFKISRTGSKVVLEGAGEDRREYEGPFFTFTQRGQIVRRWRRVP